MSKRQISSVGAQIEYTPDDFRQISSLAAAIEYKPAKFRQISSVALQVEYMSNSAKLLKDLDDAFDTNYKLLQADPLAQIDTTAYRSAIIAAYGVTCDFEVGTNAVDWDFLSLYFIAEALSTTARRMADWAEGQLLAQGIVREVDSVALFRRIFGPLIIRNVATENANAVAQTFGDRIEVYRKDGIQRVMTPNNAIHELGHVFDGLSGLGVAKLGSLRWCLDETSKAGGASYLHNNYSRGGMAEGRIYLRDPFYEHGEVYADLGSNVALFRPIDLTKLPQPTDSDYAEFVPFRYLFYPFAGTRLDMWQSSLYAGRYGNKTRFDVLVHNATATPAETAADGFLNWIRDTFGDAVGETQASKWRTFFAANLGSWLRNAAMFHDRMVQHYQFTDVIPDFPLEVGQILNDRIIRLVPIDADINELGTAFSLLPQNVEIFGWLSVASPSAILPYWLLVRDSRGRLVWVTAEAISHNEANVKASSETNWEALAPDRSYINSDLVVILGGI
jgi:hypothetical protein